MPVCLREPCGLGHVQLMMLLLHMIRAAPRCVLRTAPLGPRTRAPGILGATCRSDPTPRRKARASREELVEAVYQARACRYATACCFNAAADSLTTTSRSSRIRRQLAIKLRGVPGRRAGFKAGEERALDQLLRIGACFSAAAARQCAGGGFEALGWLRACSLSPFVESPRSSTAWNCRVGLAWPPTTRTNTSPDTSPGACQGGSVRACVKRPLNDVLAWEGTIVGP